MTLAEQIANVLRRQQESLRAFREKMIASCDERIRKLEEGSLETNRSMVQLGLPLCPHCEQYIPVDELPLHDAIES